MPYFLFIYTFGYILSWIITDDFKNARDIEIIKEVLEQKINYGFSILILNDKLTNLPNECMNFVCIGHNNRGVIFEDELVTNKQKKFIADYDESLDLTECAVKLANIPIDTVKETSSFPKAISFLDDKIISTSLDVLYLSSFGERGVIILIFSF